MEIKDLNSLLKVAEMTTQKSGKQIWWRGLANSNWDLATRLYRENRDPDEHNYAFDFRNQAPVRYPKCPDYNDHSEWLSLMQHFGVPTRLMDWTESCLIALFFAVREKNYHEITGSLWILRPDVLNENQGYGPFVQTGRGSEPLPGDAFQSHDKKQSKKICAINSTHFDPRQLMQSSVFTIHGISTPLNRLPKSDEFIEQHTVSPHAKSELLKNLILMGISEKFIFPDLEHLAKDIAKTQYR